MAVFLTIKEEESRNMKSLIQTGKELGKAVVKKILPDPVNHWIRVQRKRQRDHQRTKQDRNLFLHHLRGTDVFLVGHPKSGNTWLAYMLAFILYQDSQDEITLSNLKKYVPIIHGKDSSIAKYPNLSEPRVFRNEMPEYPDLYPKIIYLVRDPRAVLTSYYHMYLTIFNDCDTSPKDFIEEYLSQGCIKRWEIITRWDRQVLAWIQWAEQDDRVFVVKYEDMVNDRQSILEKILGFAEISCSKECLALAVSRGSFEAMQKSEEKHGVESYSGEMSQRGRFIRRGKVDGWKDEMDQLTIEQIEKEFAPVMKAVGYLQADKEL